MTNEAGHDVALLLNGSKESTIEKRRTGSFHTGTAEDAFFVAYRLAIFGKGNLEWLSMR